MIPRQHQELWDKISQFRIDDPGATTRYSDKLASTNNWSKEFTLHVIEEYKRFLFLCCVLPNGASPSEIIDEAWHLHLTYTKNYWKEFCEKTIKQDIHHHPSKGGEEDVAYHRNWYENTRKGYKQFFDEEPPRDIWPSKSIVTPKEIEIPALSLDSVYKKYLPFILLPFITPFLFYGKIDPFKLSGPEFLVFFLILVLTTVGVHVLIHRAKKKMVNEFVAHFFNGKANLYQIARFMYSNAYAMQTAVVDLVERGILKVIKANVFRFSPGNYAFDGKDENPIIINLLKSKKENEDVSYDELRNYYNVDMTFHPTLAALFKEFSKFDWWQIIGIAFLLLIGIIRTIQGLSNDNPVEYLIVLTVVGLISLLVAMNLSSRKRFFRQSFKFVYHKKDLDNYFNHNSWRVAGFVFTGIAVLQGGYMYATLQDTFYKNRAGDTGAYAGSCGGSSCGSSCGGSSCGGGGCGGCGGGD